MEIQTISVSYTRKFNLGDFESLEVSDTAWAKLDRDDDESECMEELFNICKRQVFLAVKSILENNPYQQRKHKN
jgi:hypothetical protein